MFFCKAHLTAITTLGCARQLFEWHLIVKSLRKGTSGGQVYINYQIMGVAEAWWEVKLLLYRLHSAEVTWMFGWATPWRRTGRHLWLVIESVSYNNGDKILYWEVRTVRSDFCVVSMYQYYIKAKCVPCPNQHTHTASAPSPSSTARGRRHFGGTLAGPTTPTGLKIDFFFVFQISCQSLTSSIVTSQGCKNRKNWVRAHRCLFQFAEFLQNSQFSRGQSRTQRETTSTDIRESLVNDICTIQYNQLPVWSSIQTVFALSEVCAGSFGCQTEVLFHPSTTPACLFTHLPIFLCSGSSRRSENTGPVGRHGGRVLGGGTVRQPRRTRGDGFVLQDWQEDSAERAHQTAVSQ